MTDNILSVLALAAVVIGGLGAILGGLSVVLHAIAPRTKTMVDDQLAADVDAAHDKLDEVLGLLRGIVPASSAQTTPTSTTSAPSTAAKAGTVVTVVLLAAIGGVSLAPACHTLGPAGATGLIAAIDCEAQHFTTQLVVDATHFADGKVDQLLADAAAPSSDAVVADLATFDTDVKKCALLGLVTAATSAAGSAGASPGAGSSSAVATQGLSARASTAPAAGDPLQVRAAVAAAARGAGWQIKGWTVP